MAISAGAAGATGDAAADAAVGGVRGGAATATATALDVSAVPSAAADSIRLWSPGGSGVGMMTNCPCASVMASPSVRPRSRRATFTCGAARPATTVSPVGSTLTTSKDGLTAVEAVVAAGAAAAVLSGADAFSDAVGAAGFTASVIAGGIGFGQRKTGWAK